MITRFGGFDQKMNQGSQRIGHLLLVIVVLTWGANFGVAKSAYQYLHPILFAAIRFTVSGILVLAITFWKEKGIGIRKKDLGRVAMVGALGLGFYQILWSLGLYLTSATNSALILSTQPLLGLLYMGCIKKESIKRQHYLNMLVALGGVFLVILKPTAQLRFSLTTFSGDLLTLMAAFFSAIFFSIWSRPLLEIYSPLRLMGYCMISGSSILWIAALLSIQPIALGEINEVAWWSLGYAVVFSGILGHVFWYEGIGRIGVTHSMVYLYFIPLCAALFNHFLMGEKLSLQQILGGILILVSVHRVLRS